MQKAKFAKERNLFSTSFWDCQLSPVAAQHILCNLNQRTLAYSMKYEVFSA